MLSANGEIQKGNHMNRRNVLGNQIESAKTLWIILVSILVSALQFVIYHFVGEGWVGILIGGLCVLLGGIVVHAVTGEMEELFSYLLIPCAGLGGAGLLIPKITGDILPKSSTVFIGCLLAWLIPVLYCCIFTWIEGNTALPQFSGFFTRAAVLFYIVYFGFLFYWLFFYNRIADTEISAHFLPFATFAAYIDGVINDTVPTERLIRFITERVCLFLPFGFFVAMIGRKIHSLLRLSTVLLVPIAVEILQYLLKLNSFDMDDALFYFLGGLIGMLLSIIFNRLFQSTTGKNFDGSEVETDYYGRRL